MQKYRESDIKPFEFNDLQGSHVVSQPKFENFNFKNIQGEPYNAIKTSEETIREERTHERKADFKIDGVVRDYRGLSRQEQNDIEKRISDEVERRLKAAYQDAYNEGLQLGREEGRDLSLKELDENIHQKIEELNAVIEEVKGQSSKIMEKNHQEVYEFIKRFTKWILMKEVNEKVYLENLLEKLVLELNARKNLIVKVGKANFAEMPEVIQTVESRLGQLSNVRVEIVPELNHPGIILEGENGLIDGSLEGVFKNIDKIFEMVVRGE